MGEAQRSVTRTATIVIVLKINFTDVHAKRVMQEKEKAKIKTL